MVYLFGAVLIVNLVLFTIERIKKIPVDIADKNCVKQLASDISEMQVQLRRERACFEEVKAEAAIALDTISREKALGFAWLATAYSEYQKLYDLKLADDLEDKLHPAKQAAQHVRDIAAEKAALRRENRILRDLHRYYESLFPWLIDFRGEDLDDLIRQVQDQGKAEGTGAGELEDEDPAAQWLTKAEQVSEKLARAEKFQRALDRYWQNKKTPWQIGRDYERYIGYEHERQGFSVIYHGVEQGLEDLGRDLICTNGREVRIVQCKHWNTNKTMHEKHVCQIFGTATAYRREFAGTDLFGGDDVTPWLYVSCAASERAKDFAKKLDVRLKDNYPLRRYPIIKCNVSPRGERIYHLPFDQQYDRTLIKYKDESYVETVAEAEALGFRRAFRWSGDPTTGLSKQP